MSEQTPEGQSQQSTPGPIPSPPYGYGGYPPPGYAHPYPQPAYGYPPAPKQRIIWPWVLGAVILAILLGLGGCLAFVGTVATTAYHEAKREVTVTYRVSGSGKSASILYSGRDFNSAQETGVALPWTKDVVIDGLGKSVTLTATNGIGGGSITCEIIADGQTVAQQTSSGPLATASCIGNAGGS